MKNNDKTDNNGFANKNEEENTIGNKKNITKHIESNLV